jgi:hypothetical protein
MKYAWHGSKAFNDYLEGILHELAYKTRKALGENLVALILAGGYGRGEGGIVIKNDIEMPYNDLDLILIVKNTGFDFAGLLLPISQEFAQRLEIHVDFSRPLTVANLKTLPHKLMWQDLLNGHIVLYGPADILSANMPEYMCSPLPMIEATHLLLNRGAGLIWSFRILHGLTENSEEDFIRRNYFKAALAIGDAILIASGNHQTAYRGRDSRLQEVFKNNEFADFAEFPRLYARALQFKFSPDKEPETVFNREILYKLAQILLKLFLRIEEKRLQRAFASAHEYAIWRGIREKREHLPQKLARNLVKNALMKRFSILYPRERLFRLLPVLLHQAIKPEQKWKIRSEEFMQIWEKYN